MAVTTVQSNLWPLKISTDGGTTKKAVVCKKSWTLSLNSSTSKEQSDCGSLLGLGAVEWGFDFEGVVNTSPTSGSEVSAEDLLALANNQTLFSVYPTDANSGADLYASGNVYLVDFKVTNQVGSLMTFSGRLEGTGSLDITP